MERRRRRKIKATNMNPGQGGCTKCCGFVAHDTVANFEVGRCFQELFCLNCGLREKEVKANG